MHGLKQGKDSRKFSKESYFIVCDVSKAHVNRDQISKQLFGTETIAATNDCFQCL